LINNYIDYTGLVLMLNSVIVNKEEPTHGISKLLHVSTEFLQWFVGFTDAEGNFLITLDRDYVRFRFKISLHKDDIEVLNIIKSKLGIGSVKKENEQYCSFIVNDIDSIKYIICPIFIKFPLQTNKRLDFNDFYDVIKNKEKGKNNNDINKILSIKNNMNSKRLTFLNLDANSFSINPCWLLGFIEGDGTFGIKNGSPYLQIAQKNSSQLTLNAIKSFIETLPNFQEQTIKLLPVKVTSATNKKTNVISLVVNSIDSLYYFILPLLDSNNLYTRKAIDFKLWRIALLLHKQGYYFLPEGRQLFIDISNNINKLRYTTNSFLKPNEETLNELFQRSLQIFAKPSPFDLSLGKTHIELTQAFSRAQRKLNPNIVYIYKNGELIKGSPFLKYSDAHKALGLNPSSNTCNRYLNTGKLYKNQYLFSSTLIIEK